MKKSEWIKSIFLGVLILASIIQTTILWLGDVPSQSFFDTTQSRDRGIEPSNIWFIEPSASTVGNPSSFAYKMDKTIQGLQSEYEYLITNLQVLLQMGTQREEGILIREGIDWKQLLTQPAIMYEYSMPLTLAEASGDVEKLTHIKAIDRIFVRSKSKFQRDIIIELVSTQEEKVYQMEVAGDFTEFGKIYSFYTSEEVTEEITRYQPSALSNIRQYMKGNVFMPIASERNPIVYDILTVYNPLDSGVEDVKTELDKYVNSFFVNPLLKDKTVSENGEIIFTEQTKSIVTYKPLGILEYINLDVGKTPQTTTVTSGYSQVIDFIAQTDAIPEDIKQDFYISNITQKDGSIVYALDRLYNGYKLEFHSQLKALLGIDSWIEVTVENNQVVEASICILQVKIAVDNFPLVGGTLTSDYVDPINDMLELTLAEGIGSVVFEDMDTVYVIENLEGRIYLRRSILLDNQWYYP